MIYYFSRILGSHLQIIMYYPLALDDNIFYENNVSFSIITSTLQIKTCKGTNT